MSEQETNSKPPQASLQSDVLAQVNEMQREIKEAAAHDKRYKDDQIKLNKWLAGATVALVIATVLIGSAQWWYMHRQYKLTSDSLSKMGEQIATAKDAANNAKDAVEQSRLNNRDSILAQERISNRSLDASQSLANKALSTTIDQMNLDQRPWVGLMSPEIDDDSKYGTDLYRITQIKAQLKNTGKTPAIDTTTVWMAEPLSASEPAPTYDEAIDTWGRETKYSEEQLEDRNPSPEATRQLLGKNLKNMVFGGLSYSKQLTGVIPPGIPSVIGNISPISWRNTIWDTRHRFTVDGSYIYFIGRCIYSDLITPKKTPHETDFCLVYRGDPKVGFELCPTGNTMK